VEFFDLEHVQFVIPARDAKDTEVRVGAFERFQEEKGFTTMKMTSAFLTLLPCRKLFWLR